MTALLEEYKEIILAVMPLSTLGPALLTARGPTVACVPTLAAGLGPRSQSATGVPQQQPGV
jgi:hypothetical protein